MLRLWGEEEISAVFDACPHDPGCGTSLHALGDGAGADRWSAG